GHVNIATILMRDFVTNEEIIQEARRRCAQGAWDYLVGGAESETTLRRNRQAFDKIAFRPRILVDVSHVDTSTDFLGQKLRIPAVFAPIGSLQSSIQAVRSPPPGRRLSSASCIASARPPSQPWKRPPKPRTRRRSFSCTSRAT